MYKTFDIDYSKLIFEWDDNKEKLNFANHGIKFSTAMKVFRDDKKLIRVDEEHSSELRYDVLGKVGKVLFVVCAFYEDNVVRIISARIATKVEKERYENGDYQNEIR